MRLSETAFFLCDLQEKFRPAIKHFDDILDVSKRLVAGSKLMSIPLVVTEQYPKGLGKTVSELDVSHAAGVFEKTKFSMVLPAVETLLKTLCNGHVKHIVLFGVETHVCIQQTVIDFLERGYEVHVVADATSSRSQMDRLFALQRFQNVGATVTTSEAVLLQLVGDKDHPLFKEVQGLIKVSAPVSGLIPSIGCNL